MLYFQSVRLTVTVPSTKSTSSYRRPKASPILRPHVAPKMKTASHLLPRTVSSKRFTCSGASTSISRLRFLGGFTSAAGLDRIILRLTASLHVLLITSCRRPTLAGESVRSFSL
jgi:hypothetical protein